MIKKLLSLTLIVFLFYSCSDDEFVPSEVKVQKTTEQITFDDLPEKVKANLEQVYSKKAKTNYGFINSDKLIIENRLNASTTYNIALRASQKKTTRHFDNLVIHDTYEGETEFYLFRYIPTTEWLDSERELNLYSGQIKMFDFSTGNRLAIFEMIDGVEAGIGEGSKVCRWEHTGEFLCTELYGYEYCSYTLREVCGGGSSSGNDGGNYGNPTHGSDPNPFPDNPPSNGGGSGGSGGLGNPDSNGPGDGLDVTPIIDENGGLIVVECPEGEQPNYFGICEAVEEDQIINELDGKEKCLNEHLDKKGDSFVKDILNKFEGESEFDIKIVSKNKVFKDGVTSGDGVNGKTKYVKGSSLINIEISTSKLSNMPALAAARTLIHEYIHADMFRKINTNNYDGNLDFKTTYEKYKNEKQHNAMADLYVSSISDALKDFHRNVLTGDYNYLTNNGINPIPNSFYEALAWQGLKDANVSAYFNLSDSKKTELTNALNNYYHSTTKNCPD